MKNLIVAALLFCSAVVYCNQQSNTEELIEPYYVIDFNAVNCRINISVNDVPVFSMNIDGQVSTTIPINSAIFESGSQRVTYHVLPLSGESSLKENTVFEASVWLYYDWVDDWYDKKEEINTFAMPENKTGTPLAMYEGENSFFAEVPYTVDAWQNAQDLSKIENLRTLVIAAYRKVENLINNG